MLCFKFPAGPNYITVVKTGFNELFVYGYDGVFGIQLTDELDKKLLNQMRGVYIGCRHVHPKQNSDQSLP